MSVEKIERKESYHTAQIYLPNNLEKIISKINIAMIDFFAKIQVFFKSLFFGSRKVFNKKVKMTTEEIVDKNKLQLYRNKKNLENLNKDKKSNSNLKVYEVFPVSVNEEDYQKIKMSLDNIINNNCDYNILISLQKLVKNENLPQKIKDLINQKLKQIFQIEQRRENDLKANPKTDKVQLDTYPSALKIAAVSILILAGLAIASYGIYPYFKKIQFLFPNFANKKPFTLLKNSNDNFTIQKQKQNFNEQKLLGYNKLPQHNIGKNRFTRIYEWVWAANHQAAIDKTAERFFMQITRNALEIN